MVTDARTASRNYPKPHVANTRGEEFARLITAMDMVDADVAALLVAVAARALAVHTHAIADVPGLQEILDGKAALVHSHALAGLTDVSGAAGAGSYMVLARIGGSWQPWTIDIGQTTGMIDESRLPAVAITDTFEVASQAAMLALTAQRGDVAVRSDLNRSYILKATPATTLANWIELRTPTDAVLSVAGLTGAITASALWSAAAVFASAAELRAGADATKALTAASVLGAMAWVPVTYAATITPDHAAGVNQSVTLAGNPAIAAPANPKPGWQLNLRFKQDATGGRAPTWNAAFDFGDASVPAFSTAAGAEDLVSFLCVDVGKYAYLGIRRRID